MSERLERLRDALLVQCSVAEAHNALSLADRRAGTGVVVSTHQRRDVWALADAAERDGTSLLVDAALYTGKARRLASERFDPAWLRVQREAGLPVLLGVVLFYLVLTIPAGLLLGYLERKVAIAR